MQVYFLGDENTEINHRCGAIDGLNREIISSLQKMLHENNHLIQIFKYALEQLPKDDYKIVLKADKIPSDHHVKRYNLPTINEVAILMVDTEANNRDIIICKRNNTLQRVCETHKSYDSLQYPLLFPLGEDGYHFELKLFDQKSGCEIDKKVYKLNFFR